uniref:Uncharacterized protein n=1 Tax=Rhizophora mucronata TaxID=61149 RepID=A0A2P2LV55_RHIMU
MLIVRPMCTCWGLVNRCIILLHRRVCFEIVQLGHSHCIQATATRVRANFALWTYILWAQRIQKCSTPNVEVLLCLDMSCGLLAIHQMARV